ncbi:hypothetical protein [Corynebacterium sp.]|uniref:hypothetical protein n=1 Tax=Corynebacterium sp. TaxID=1720 RepID=UPI0028B1AE3F|nr:hypothetical protein [Corynebacterium sp.]
MAAGRNNQPQQYRRPPSREQRGRGTLGPRKTFRQKLVDAIFAIPPRMRLYIAIALLIVIIVAAITAVVSRGGGEDQASEETAISTSASPAPLDVTVNPSRPVEMYIPSIDLRADFEAENCAVTDGAIDPDTMSEACTYTSDDRPYSQPGTDASDIVVIAGHTGAGVPAVFNDLYDGTADEHQVAVGDELFIRTEESDDLWLVYEAMDLHEPEKSGLSQSAEIWGTSATPGRLLTISCIQPPNLLQAAVKNAVVGWQYSRVVDAI